MSVLEEQLVTPVQSVNHTQSINPSTLIPSLPIPKTLITNPHIAETLKSKSPILKTCTSSVLNLNTPILTTHIASTPIQNYVQSVKSLKAKPFPLKRHRRGKRNSIKLFTKTFKWVGNNIAGANSKWASVKRWIRLKTPSILSLQETKFKVSGKHNFEGYFTYEHLRTEKTAGGGILMAVKKELSPALVRDGGEEVEALTVDIFVKKMSIACTTAYGPQEKDLKEKRYYFGDF